MFWHLFQPSTPLVALQRDTFLYRSYISQGNYRIVLQELKSADPMLQPLKSLVDYLSPGANKLAVVADIDARVSFYSESLRLYQMYHGYRTTGALM